MAKQHCFCWALKIGKYACCRCGLLRLRNPATDVAARKPCPGREDD